MAEERDQAATLNKAHGRVEHRELTSSTMLNDHLDWPGVKQVCRLRRRTLRRGVWRNEVAYAITSVARTRADAVCLFPDPGPAPLGIVYPRYSHILRRPA